MSRTRFPGWRTMTAAQRYNARKDAIFEDARRRADLCQPKIGAAFQKNQTQIEIAGTEPHLAGHLQNLANARLIPAKNQLPCDVGLFGDEGDQLDLIEMFQ